MNPNKLKEITINLPEKFDNILKKIDENGLGVIFVVDKLNRLKGSITDGDIRRFYLKKIVIAYFLFWHIHIQFKEP